MSQTINTIGSLSEKKCRLPYFLRCLLYFYFFISFYEPFLNGVIGSVMKYYIFFVMGLFLLYFRNFHISNYHIAYLIWLIYKFISLLWTTNFWMFNATAVSQVGMVAWLICLTGVNIDNETLDGIVNSIAIGSFSIGLLSIFFSEPYHGSVESRQVLTLFGEQCEPNNQGAYIVIGFTIFLYRIFNSDKNRLFYFIALLVNAYSTLKTGSRTGLTTLAVVVLVIFFASIRKKGFSAFKGVIIGIIALVILYFVVRKYLPQNTFDRLFEFDTYKGGSERDILWKNAFGLFKKGLNPIFGAGWGAYFGYNGIYKAVHNTYLGMLCDVGILGFLLFFVPVINAIWQLWKRRNILPICFFITAAVPAFFIEAINKRYFWNAVILLFLYYERCKLENKSEEKELPSNESWDFYRKNII